MSGSKVNKKSIDHLFDIPQTVSNTVLIYKHIFNIYQYFYIGWTCIKLMHRLYVHVSHFISWWFVVWILEVHDREIQGDGRMEK